jgi:hypothetical protein
VIKTLKKWHFLMHVVVGLRIHKNGVKVKQTLGTAVGGEEEEL